MSDSRDLLIELGTEELPPKTLMKMLSAFSESVESGFAAAALNYGEISKFASPRRLALIIRKLDFKQADREEQKRGPAIKAAWDDEGAPTKAAQGFARSCGVEVADLETLSTDEGAWLAHTQQIPGANTQALVPEILKAALNQLPIAKRMRWADRDDEFVRPVQWLILLFGTDVIPCSLMGVESGNLTRGHRFHHPDTLEVASPDNYVNILEERGKVMVDFNRRREHISKTSLALALAAGGSAVIDADLLDEVSALVEWPVPLLGDFEERFLDVPHEALITTMQDNQKYFPVVDANNRLLPHFITVANIESHDPEQIKIGNERVIRPRFADAEFFWGQDRKQPLVHHLEALKSVIFQNKLGSTYDKVQRLSKLALSLSHACGANAEWCERAGELSKCDLLSSMVQEFPELQGIMGRYYANHDGEPAEVAQALQEHYLPRHAGDHLPKTPVGNALALADRLDTLVGIFAIGQVPTGTKDPFALRRAALGVIRIILENGLELDLKQALQWSAEGFDESVKADEATSKLFDFIMERLRGYYTEAGFGHDEFEAVLHCAPTSLGDFDKRLRAVADFRQRTEGESLAAANKRARNILKKFDGAVPEFINATLLHEPTEKALSERLESLSASAVPMMESGQYGEALTILSALRESVDSFFDNVLVMAEDEALRDNRLALLNQLSSVFLRVADFSRLQTAENK